MEVPASVLDLPPPWLALCIRALDRAARLAVFCTCKGFRDLVLYSADSTSLTLQPLEMNQQLMLQALQLAQQRASALTVCILGPVQDYLQPEHWDWKARQVTKHSCSLLHQARHMGYLRTVTRLELTGVELAMPLMPVFSDACPNLTALTLQESNITWEGVTADSFSTGFLKLQHLHLHNVTSWAPNEACQQGLQQQVAQLTGLKSLKLMTDINLWQPYGCYYALDDAIAAALTPTIVSQLVQTALPWCFHPSELPPWEYSTFRSVQVLQLHDAPMDDALMQQLLTLPNLTSVSVNTIRLKESLRGQVCHWEQLGVHTLDMDALSKLPLHSTLQIKGLLDKPLRFEVPALNPCAHVLEALDNINTSHWSGWGGSSLRLTNDLDNICIKGEDLKELLPLFAGIGRLILCGVQNLEESLMILGGYIVAQQSAFMLDLSLLYCTWTDTKNREALAQLISRLPAGSSIILQDTHEATVIQLCCAAQCSFALHVKRSLRSRLLAQRVPSLSEQHVIDALTCAGCQHVHVHKQATDWVVVVNNGQGHGAESSVPNSHSWAALLCALPM